MEDQKQLEEMKEYLQENVAMVFEKMTMAILDQKPKDVIEFMQEWLKINGPELKE